MSAGVYCTSPVVYKENVSQVYLEMANEVLSTSKEVQNWKASYKGETVRLSGTTGLYLKGQLTGHKSYVLRKYNQWSALGACPAMSLKQARELAALVSAKWAKKEDKGRIDYALRKSSGDKDQFMSVFDEAKNPAHRSGASEATIDDLMQLYLEKHEPTLAQGPSRRRPRSLYNHHFREEFGSRQLGEVTRGDIFRYLSKVYEEKFDTGKKLRGVLDGAFEMACDLEWLELNPMPSSRSMPKRLTKPRPHKTIEHFYFPSLWQSVRQSTSSNVVKAVILVGMTTALRFGVINRVRHKDLNLETGEWVINEIEGPNTEYRIKSGEKFDLWLPEQLLAAVKELLPELEQDFGPNDWVFKSPMKPTVPVTDTSINKCLKATGYNLTFHGFRNAIKIWGKNNGFDRDLMDAYCQHGLKGLDKSYRREDTLEARNEVTKKLNSFILDR